MSGQSQAPPRRRARRRVTGAVAVGLAALLAQAATPVDARPPGAAAPALAAPVTQRAAQAVSAEPRSSSFLGGLEWDEGSDVEVDRAGNSYVTGFTLSPDLRVVKAAQGSFRGLADAFVTKVSADGRRVLWSTYLGGVDLDVAHSMAMDASGNVYVTGRTASPDFPTTRGALQPRLRGGSCQGEPCHDAFVTKISSEGRVVYSTLLGGRANEEGISIAVDRSGRAWVTGNTDSSDFPVRSAVQSRFQSPPCPGDLPCEYDVFVSALAADGRRLAFSSYLGGDAGDTSGGIAVDEAGNAYVTGTTRSSDFPVTRGALRRSINGRACGPPPGAPCLDAFVTKISASAFRLDYSTYVGGTRDERSSGIAVNRSGQAVITGSTRSPDLRLAKAIQSDLDNAACTTDLPEEQCDDGFVAQLTRDGRSLVFSTYLGGRAEDQGLAVTVDPAGNVHVVGRTDSRDFPTKEAAQPEFGGYIDGFATEFAAGTGALVRSTFLGGSEADRATGVDTSTSRTVHVTGRTLSPDFPTAAAFQDALRADDYDAFLTTLDPR